MTSHHAPNDDGAIRARRFEVVDDEGNIRAVFGMLPAIAPVGESVGFEITHPSGPVGASCAVGEAEGWLALTLGGNTVAHLGVVSDVDASGPQVVLVVCAADGAPVAGWRVDDDGSLTRVHAPPS